MSFAARICRHPRSHDSARAAEVATLFAQAGPEIGNLIAAAAGSSPYLADIAGKEADWLIPALDAPEQAVADQIAGLQGLAPGQLSVALRQAKRRIALITALADLGGVWPLEQVTAVLTDLADTAVQVCVETLVAAEVARGKLPPGGPAPKACGMVILAMGKMGARELNYSSDIDLICLFDESRFAPDDYHAVRSAFIRVTRKMTALLSDIRDGGYVFRTDLRLRPDPSATPVCLSMEAAERYYESVGRTWERAAFIKARVCAGDRAAGQRFLDGLRPFVWRRHLDFAAIQDAHDMRLRIRDHKGFHGPVVLEGHNVKLGRGGIREIEFFTQTRQLIAGGRDPGLRERATGPALQALATAGWIGQDVADALYDHYSYLRKIEHRLQMINDSQTHDLPRDADGFDRLAAMMGCDSAHLRAELADRFAAVHRLTEGFFAPDTPDPAPGDWGQDVVARWQTYPALRTDRARQTFSRITPGIMAHLGQAARPDQALAAFDGFLAGLPAGVQVFSLFAANPKLSRLIVDICATAPALAHYLSRNAGVLDAVIGGDFFVPWPGAPGLARDLRGVLDQADDYELALGAARRWMREWHFRIGVHFLRGLIDAQECGAQYADLAQAVLRGLWPVVIAEFARKHGTPPGRGAIVVAMGSLGAGRLTAASDLDLILIYDAGDVAQSDGPRPLPTRSYFARLTQTLITALSAKMGDGQLYEVDMRLRPSGRQGPVATAWPAFKAYQRDEAWTWEHLALTRARAVAGSRGLARDFERFRRQLLAQKADGTGIIADTRAMRARLAAHASKTTGLLPRRGPGWLQDIELFAQALALRSATPARQTMAQLDRAVADRTLDAADGAALQTAFTLYGQTQMALRFLDAEDVAAHDLAEGAKRLILRETGCDRMDDLSPRLTELQAGCARLIEKNLDSA